MVSNWYQIGAKSLYRSKFEDEYGGIGFKDIMRPEIAEFLYEYLPLIDKHNKQRQNILDLERSWPTRCCWFRLCCTLLGMAVTDLYRLYRYHDYDTYHNMGVVIFSNLICGGMKKRKRSELPNAICFNNHEQTNQEMLVRITNTNGESTKSVATVKSKASQGSKGCGVQSTCWMCHYRNKHNLPRCTQDNHNGTRYKYKYTSYCCKKCSTPLCNDRSPKEGNNLTCIFYLMILLFDVMK